MRTETIEEEEENYLGLALSVFVKSQKFSIFFLHNKKTQERGKSLFTETYISSTMITHVIAMSYALQVDYTHVMHPTSERDYASDCPGLSRIHDVGKHHFPFPALCHRSHHDYGAPDPPAPPSTRCHDTCGSVSASDQEGCQSPSVPWPPRSHTCDSKQAPLLRSLHSHLNHLYAFCD